MRISKKTKSIISGILLVAIIAGVLALAGSLLGKETKTISSTEFSVGGINAQGNYVESKTSIYTKDMFECQGLSIEPDFEATGTYKVFYYDSNKNFIGATDELNAEDGVYTRGDDFVNAQYARIMITPDVPVDEDGNEVEDFKIRFYEVTSYASDYTITVNKEQKGNVYSENLMKVKGYGLYENNGFTSLENANHANGFLFAEDMNISDYDSVLVIMPKAIFTNEATNLTLRGDANEKLDFSLVDTVEKDGNVMFEIKNLSDFDTIRLYTHHEVLKTDFEKVCVYGIN